MGGNSKSVRMVWREVSNSFLRISNGLSGATLFLSLMAASKDCWSLNLSSLPAAAPTAGEETLLPTGVLRVLVRGVARLEVGRELGRTIGETPIGAVSLAEREDTAGDETQLLAVEL